MYFNFKQHQISPAMYLPEWVVSLFLNHVPFEMTARLWDVIILEGDSFLFRVCVAVLGILESRLFFPDQKELLEGASSFVDPLSNSTLIHYNWCFPQTVLVLRGENKAALEVARRTGVAVDLTARYEQYGMSEQALWARIYEMDDWWRETTWCAVDFHVAEVPSLLADF